MVAGFLADLIRDLFRLAANLALVGRDLSQFLDTFRTSGLRGGDDGLLLLDQLLDRFDFGLQARQRFVLVADFFGVPLFRSFVLDDLLDLLFPFLKLLELLASLFLVAALI